jgi:hypothetical protein
MGQACQDVQRLPVIRLLDHRAGIMGITDTAGLTDQKHAGCSQREELFDLQIMPGDLRAFVGHDRVWHGVASQIAFNRAWAVGDYNQDGGIQGFELGEVMAQLRHMVGAVRSDKADVEYQQDISSPVKIGQAMQLPSMVR